MDLSTFHSQFRDETADNIRVLNAGLLALESTDLPEGERQEHINAIFRAMHTIKGSSRLLGFESVGRIAHTCEHILGAVRENRRDLTRELADDLLRGGDAILELVSALVDGKSATVDVDALTTTLGRNARSEQVEQTAQALMTSPPPVVPVPIATDGDTVPALPAEAPAQPDAAARKSRSSARQTIRVRVDRLDRLLNLAGELAVAQQAQAIHLQSLEDLRAVVSQQQRVLLELERELRRLRFSPVQRETIDRHLNAVLNKGDQAHKLLKAQSERFDQHTGHTKQLVSDLEQEVMAARLLPVSTLYANLPRAIRELSNASGKEVTLALSGETTELDRKVIEALADPVIHIIRNAIDHGIETPEERERAGKPRQGTVRVEARAYGAHAQLIISDDGRGMDSHALRQAAVRKGLMTEEVVERLTDQEALELIFLPGFSTAKMITDISGRGVGMDVVRTNVLELGGQVQIDARVGAGTTITLVLPLTLVTTRVLTVEIGDHTFALPASACHGSTWAYPEAVRTIEGRAIITYEGRYIPVLRLADLLDVAGARPFPSERRTPTVLIGTAQRPLAVLVDRLVDEREVVVKPLGPLMEQQKRYSGAIQFGDGRLILMLNPITLAQVARGMALVTRVAQRDAARRRSRLLVADDSFTTRELISSILQSAGYEVTTAVDGLDALDKLRGDTYDLVVSDVEMPRVDGFQLTNRIRKELGQSELPVIIVTSLASDAHRRRGLEVGAQAYIVKSQFDQSNLLETIRQLLGS